MEEIVESYPKRVRVKKGKIEREIKSFKTQKIMNSLVLLLLSNKEPFPFFFVFSPFFFSFLQHTLSCESDVRGCGDGRKIGDITIFLQLYNKYKSEFVASTSV